MKYKIGYRTIKTALGTPIAIMIAQYLSLQNFASAGIITILCIKVTKKKSLRASWDRFLACVLAILFSTVFFEGISYHPIMIGVVLLFFIPTVVVLRASDGIVTSSVIILHMFIKGQVTFAFILNEIALVVIGIGVALIMNLYMPSVENQLSTYQEEIERNLQKIFKEIVLYLRTYDSRWDGKELVETSRLIAEAKTLAFRDVENHFLRYENLYYNYFKMREKQFEIIERVLPIVTSIPSSVEQGQIVADFIEDISNHIHPGNTANIFLDKLNQMRVGFQNMELPKDRKEFETRAALLHFVKEMEGYLILKRSFSGLNKNKKLHKTPQSGAK
ncbi:aromatic acid exporter family protein (plasmid) [Bacillus sp. 31A1R]|uniref:Aromatic acid exporter family protein n=1 Tax=Robertmurraya mangrovi TaxID=3098077 RepID=A0ABU5IVA1_9BACI|nr:aromatic acid exporter family protein [Bacillus sp. 31A1R]MDZ5471088.1 aromatic acid exporter family protein [Bacillus sp. 31A1R]